MVLGVAVVSLLVTLVYGQPPPRPSNPQLQGQQYPLAPPPPPPPNQLPQQRVDRLESKKNTISYYFLYFENYIQIVD